MRRVFRCRASFSRPSRCAPYEARKRATWPDRRGPRRAPLATIRGVEQVAAQVHPGPIYERPSPAARLTTARSELSPTWPDARDRRAESSTPRRFGGGLPPWPGPGVGDGPIRAHPYRPLPRSWLWWRRGGRISRSPDFVSVLPANRPLFEWRDPGSNRGHHDFSVICKSPWVCGFAA